MKCEFKTSKTEINFLDTTMFNVHNKLGTKVYVNQSKDSYLRNKLEHPNSIKRGIFYSQALRFNKICYNRSDLRNSCKRLLKGANAELKVSLYVCVHIKTIPSKFPFLNPDNSRVICP